MKDEVHTAILVVLGFKITSEKNPVNLYKVTSYSFVKV